MAPRHLPWGGEPRETSRDIPVPAEGQPAGPSCRNMQCTHTHTHPHTPPHTPTHTPTHPLALITNGPGRVMCVCVSCFPFLFCTTAAQSLAFLGSYTKQKSATVRDGLVGRGWYEECLLYSPGWPRMHECVAGRPTPTVHLPY